VSIVYSSNLKVYFNRKINDITVTMGRHFC